jgi:hypothetical protein
LKRVFCHVIKIFTVSVILRKCASDQLVCQLPLGKVEEGKEGSPLNFVGVQERYMGKSADCCRKTISTFPITFLDAKKFKGLLSIPFSTFHNCHLPCAVLLAEKWVILEVEGS